LIGSGGVRDYLHVVGAGVVDRLFVRSWNLRSLVFQFGWDQPGYIVGAILVAIWHVSKEWQTSHPEIAEEFSVVNLERRAGKLRVDVLRNQLNKGESTWIALWSELFAPYWRSFCLASSSCGGRARNSRSSKPGRTGPGRS